MRHARLRFFLTFGLAAAVLAGCTAAARPTLPAAPTQAPLAVKSESTVVPFVGKLSLSPNRGKPGTPVTVTGVGLPAATTLQLNWNTVDGSWVLKGDYQEEFNGRQFRDVAVPLSQVKTDAAGGFEARFTVPEDWGFDHDITLVDPATGTVKNRANFRVDMQVSISPTSGPPGTPITVEVNGSGYRNLENSWVMLYDNKLTGWVSAVTTRGKARVVIPAAGSPGKHLIQVSHGWSSVVYLNLQQSPAPDRGVFQFDFTITDGEPVLPPPAASQSLKPEPGVAPGGTGPALWTNPASAPVGTPVKLYGRGLPPGQTVDLTWSRMVGNRIAGAGWSIESISLGKAAADKDGNLTLDFAVPNDLGSTHRLEARSGDKALASGSFLLTPSIFELEPSHGPPGTSFKVHIRGGGWTETGNIFTLDYDNSYIGFGCGFNSQGDLQIFLRASGDPGWHFIDLYPAIYKGQDIAGVHNFRFPQLTGDRDHPGEQVPIFHLAFHVDA